MKILTSVSSIHIYIYIYTKNETKRTCAQTYTPLVDIVHRKSDVRKKGKTRGWELMLSYSFSTRTTTGYVKGTPSSDVITALAHLKACAAQIGHPLLLPVIIFSHDLSPANDQKQRDARDWLRRLENAVSLRNEVEEHEQYFQDGLLEVDGLNRDLVECHGHVLWKRPQAYLALAREMEAALGRFWDLYCEVRAETKSLGGGLVMNGNGHGLVNGNAAGVGVGQSVKALEKQAREVEKLHKSMLSRLDFYKVKLKGLENYIHITLERLKVQREAVSF